MAANQNSKRHARKHSTTPQRRPDLAPTATVKLRRGEWVGTGRVTLDHFSGCWRQGALVIDGPRGGPYNPVQAVLEGIEVLAISDGDRELLRKAGYTLKGL